MAQLSEIPNFLKIKNAFFALQNANKEQAFVLANLSKKEANLTQRAAARTTPELLAIDAKRREQIIPDQTAAQNRVAQKAAQLTALSADYQAFLVALTSNQSAALEFAEHPNNLAGGLATFFAP